MNPNQQDLSLEQSIDAVMQELPPVIRTFIAEGRHTMATQSLMSKYKLRVDQGGVLERETMLLLMGIESPSEFVQTLIEEARIDQQTVGNIVQDVNAQIFVPLRDAERRGGLPEVAKPKASFQMPQAELVARPVQQPVPPKAANPAPVMNMASMYAPPLQSPRYPHQQSESESMISFTRPAAAKSVPSQQPQQQAPQRPIDTAPSHLLEDHEEPRIEFAPANEPTVPSPERNVPPTNLPGAVPEVPTQTPPPGPSRPYSADPYREPFEE